jgi:tetratricopeptide (TPR) repeat protein
MGRFDESIAESNKALELDPLSLIINLEAGLPYYFRHQYDKALEHFQKAVALDPNFALVYIELGWVYKQTGEHQKSIAALEKAAQLDDTSPFSRHLLQPMRVQAKLAKQSASCESSNNVRRPLMSRLSCSRLFINVLMMISVLDLLEKAYEQHDWALVWVKVGVPLEPLRSNPRLVALLRRMNFPGSTVETSKPEKTKNATRRG